MSLFSFASRKQPRVATIQTTKVEPQSVDTVLGKSIPITLSDKKETIASILETLSPCADNECGISGGATADRPSLADLLQPSCRDREVVEAEHAQFNGIIKHVAGAPDKSLPIYDYWKPALMVYQYTTPVMLGVPFVDIGAAQVSPHLRRLVLLTSSLQYKCYFCAAHAVALGDAINGSWRAQLRALHHNNTAALASPIEEPLSAKDFAALQLVASATSIPSKVTLDMKRNARMHFDERNYQLIACISSYIGWANAVSDSMGMELEAGNILWAQERLRGHWHGRRHSPASFDPNGPNESLVQEAQAEEHVLSSGFYSVLDYYRLALNVIGTSSIEAKWLKNFPVGHGPLGKLLEDSLGFQPEYITNLLNADAKRAIVFSMWQFLLKPLSESTNEAPYEWSPEDKARLWYAYATKAQNSLLQGHAAFYAHQVLQISTDDLGEAGLGRRSTASAPFAHALKFVRESASTNRSYRTEDNLALFKSTKSPAGVMELVTLLGVFTLLHRLSGMMATEPFHYEPVVEAFLTSGAGQTLGLPARASA
ncbi:uncharacterized protein BJ171DRAFT_540725 [Polychytrium aggregatum]|uniref:uncharacterized protein n=1 Tax=Polychytrium aggregatum TaxID=110093 RepID=UPI0022FF04E7|nr:uncharacterized protein BJ171DRAFT_540725 [Polychytrium aggregatum]KAI9190778.1 hypothetical protein BJ171DRAFT_540725 [Polychytrium aggregatum]